MRSTQQKVTSALIAIAGITAVSINAPTAFASTDSPPLVVNTDAASDIELFVMALRASKKPLPAWLLDLALRAADLTKTYNNGKRVREVQAEVASIVRVLREVQAAIESGRELTVREFRLVRELLDTHTLRLSDLTGRMTLNETQIAEQQKQIERYRQRTLDLERELANERAKIAKLAARFYRKCGYGKAYHNGKCINRITNPSSAKLESR
jgi:cell division protein FtsB